MGGTILAGRIHPGRAHTLGLQSCSPVWLPRLVMRRLPYLAHPNAGGPAVMGKGDSVLAHVWMGGCGGQLKELR